jgi:hypothetical protein
MARLRLQVHGNVRLDDRVSAKPLFSRACDVIDVVLILEEQDIKTAGVKQLH